MTEGYLWLNGNVIPASEARISPFDGGFLYGDGLFETLRIEGGKPRFLARHLDRLERSAEIIRLPLPERRDISHGIEQVIDANGWEQARLRVTCSRGEEGGASTLLIHGRVLTTEELHPEPIALGVMPFVRDRYPFPVRLKSLNYQAEITGLRRMREEGYMEGVFLTEEGEVTEGGMSNIFCLHEGRLLTPPLTPHILPGIMREVILECSHKLRLPIFEERFPLQTLFESDEVFITNAIRQIVPVKRVKHQVLQGEVPGQIAQRLIGALEGEHPTDV